MTKIKMAKKKNPKALYKKYGDKPCLSFDCPLLIRNKIESVTYNILEVT